MTDAELNRKLADVLGWEDVVGIEGHSMWELPPNEGGYNPRIYQGHFSPATDRNHLAEHVLPEVERRGLFPQLALAILDDAPVETQKRVEASMLARKLTMRERELAPDIIGIGAALMSPPRVLAAAALKVLGGGK